MISPCPLALCSHNFEHQIVHLITGIAEDDLKDLDIPAKNRRLGSKADTSFSVSLLLARVILAHSRLQTH